MAGRPFAGHDPSLFPAVIGVDEVGAGALCGPVMVAAVWFSPPDLPADLLAALDDSKRLRAAERRRIAEALGHHARSALAARSAARIDAVGLRIAIHEAMVVAVSRLGGGAALPVAIDGTSVPAALADRAEAVVRGDGRVPQIAAASILAKVCRDRLMARLDRLWPEYGWAQNVGYGTAAHRAALTEHGATPHHRRSYAPVAAVPLRPRGR